MFLQQITFFLQLRKKKTAANVIWDVLGHLCKIYANYTHLIIYFLLLSLFLYNNIISLFFFRLLLLLLSIIIILYVFTFIALLCSIVVCVWQNRLIGKRFNRYGKYVKTYKRLYFFIIIATLLFYFYILAINLITFFISIF